MNILSNKQFDQVAQQIVAFGILIFLFLWGISLITH